MKYINTEKLIAEIERLSTTEYGGNTLGDDVANGALDYVLEEIIPSLQKEQPDKYETALEKAREWMSNINQGGHAMLINIFPELGEGLDPCYGDRKQEQPKVDVEKYIKEDMLKYRYLEKVGGIEKEGRIYTISEFHTLTARHFFELGFNARKEELEYGISSKM